jgi:hypothetical protein
MERKSWATDRLGRPTEEALRAKAGMERTRWAEAEAAFDEAVVARPLDTAILLERARFLAAHSRVQRADDDFTRAYILGNREPALLDTFSSSESLFRRVVAESAGSAAPLWANKAQTQQSRHRPQSSGPHFAEGPEGERKVVGTGRSSPESASNHGRFRSVQRKGEIAPGLQTARKCHTDKPFGYFAVHDTVVGFTPCWGESPMLISSREGPASGPRGLGVEAAGSSTVTGAL